MSKRLRDVSGGRVTEASNGFRAVLIRSGKSRNGNVWRPEIIRALARMAEGAAINVFDASADAKGKLLTHWATVRDRLPPGIRKYLPPRIPDARAAVVRNAQVVETDGALELVGDIVPVDERSGSLLSSLIARAKQFGRELGISIHMEPDEFEAVATESGKLDVTAVLKQPSWDVVSFPSAGGRFLPVLEAFSEEDDGMKFLERLLARLNQQRREALTGTFEVPADVTAAGLVEDHAPFVEAFMKSIGYTAEVPDGAMPAVLEALAVDPPEGTSKKRLAKLKRDREDYDPNEGVTRLQRDGAINTPGRETATKKPAKKATEEEDRIAAVEETVGRVVANANRAMVRGLVAGAKLTESAASFVTDHFEDVIDRGDQITESDVSDFIKAFRKGAGRSESSSSLVDPANAGRSPFIAEQYSEGDKVLAAFQAMMDNQPYAIVESADGSKMKIPAFRGLRHAYGVITGDVYCDGREYYRRPLAERRQLGVWESLNWDDNPFFVDWVSAMQNRGMSVTEAMNTASFTHIFSNLMHKSMLRDYRQQDFLWRLIARPETVTDFKTWNYHRTGEFDNLPVVNENAAYTDWDTNGPSEEKITLAIQKRGGYAQLTWEMIVNDDMSQIRTWPGKISRAAMRTLNQHVFNFLINNSNYGPDTTALAHASHANLETTALDLATLKALRKKIRLQADLDDLETHRFRGRRVLVGEDNYDAAYELIFSDGKPNLSNIGGTPSTDNYPPSSENPGQPNVLRSRDGLELYSIPQFGTGADASANDYWMTDVPDEVDMIIVGFLNGQTEPSLFVQDMQNVGVMFDGDQVRWKVRHIYEGAIADYKPFAASIVA